MRRPTALHRPLVALSLFVLLAPALGVAQDRPARRRQDTVAAAVDSGPRVLTLADYGPWKRIAATAISRDGAWMTYTFRPNDGDQTLFVRQLDAERVDTVPVGPAPSGGGRGGFGGGGAGGPVFSHDSRWLGYYVLPPSRDGARRRGRPGGRGAGGAARPTRRFVLRELATGDTSSVPNAASFQFSNDGRWLAARTNRAADDTTHDGTDLLLRELATGATRNIGNVDEYAFDDAGRLFAYTVDAVERLGNGVYVVDLATGATRALHTADADFAQLSWSEEGAHLAVLRGDKADSNAQKDNVLLAWTGVGGPRERAVLYDPAADDAFPDAMVVSEFGAPRWSRDGSRIFLGIKEQEPAPPETDEDRANVDVWHWKDELPQSVQIVRLQQLRRSTYPAVLHVAGTRFVQLGDDDMRSVDPTRDGRWAIGRLDAPYRHEVSWGGSRADYYRVNVANGERTLIARGLGRTMGTSPNSRWFLYLQEGHVYAYDLESGQARCLDEEIGVSFVDETDDHPYERPIYGVAGWSTDGRSVILNHRYDLWQLPLAGGQARNLTGGLGAERQIRFRVVRFDEDGQPRGGGGGRFRRGGDEDDEGIDLTRPLLLSAFGDWTKQSGYWRLPPRGTPTPLLWDDKAIGDVEKAADADRVIFTQQTFSEFPDYWVSDSSFGSPRRVTDANPQLADYAWGSKVLIDYTNRFGQRLQGTLTLPAGYEPGKRYPLLVYHYELMSNRHHAFSMPVYDDRPHISTYASGGYLVLQPDIVYEVGRPGTSALDCVTAAVNRVIELGYADPDHIGLQGHSWGGYESSYMVTQTDLFAAVVTGAPPTNLVSMYDELYKSTGTVHHGIFEVGQVRMGRDSTPWNAEALYESQSPIHHVRDITTPFLILQGTADGAVDWLQGVEFFNAAQRNGKEVIFLSYPDEPHHLNREANQKDFQIRMRQFFDHYLMGAPAPDWMENGVPQVDKGEPVR